MAVNFPVSPTENQEYSYGSRTWRWNGYAWDIKNTSSTLTKSAIDTAIGASENGDDEYYYNQKGEWKRVLTTNDFTPVTYAELKSLITNNNLIANHSYLIEDYQTIYQIPNTSEIVSCPIEPLIVTSISTNSLMNIAYSQAFPEDVIYYNVDNNELIVEGCSDENNAKGYIYRRIDTYRNNDIGFDYRNVKFRRWKIEVTDEHVDGNSSFPVGTVLLKSGTSEIYLKLNNLTLPFSSDAAWAEYPFDNLEYVSHSPDNLVYGNNNMFIIPVTSEYFDFKMFSTQPTTSGVEADYLNISNNIMSYSGVYRLSSLSSVFFTHDNSVYGNTISGIFEGNTLEYNFEGNKIGDNFYYNTISDSIMNNNFDNDFYSNLLGRGMALNTFSKDVSQNIFCKDYSYNTSGINFYGNIIPKSCFQNTFGNAVNKNIFCYSFNQNTVESNLNSIYGVDFTGNTLFTTGNITAFNNKGNKPMCKYYDEFNVLHIIPLTIIE